MVTAVVGANWGDEGKGKITDMLAEKADIIVRFQGGANAGHTIINDYGKFALHTLPSGVFYDHTTSIIGNGVALDVKKLMKEINSIVEKNVPMPKILVSDRAQIVMSYHVLFDTYEEERLAGRSFGSTKSGIAPFYSDKYAKIGIQVSELSDMDELRIKVENIVLKKNIMLKYLYNKPELSVDDIMAELAEYKEMLAPYVCDTSLYLYNALKEGKSVLLEGQLGTMKDPDHGIYPTFRPTKLKESWRSQKPIHPQSEQANLYLRFSAMKPKPSAASADPAASTAQRPAVRDEWDGMTALRRNTAAVCRAQRMLPLLSLTRLVIWMKSRCA